MGATSDTSQSPPRLIRATRNAGVARLGGWPGVFWVTRRITATLATVGPSASIPAARVAACAVTLRRAISALDFLYCSLNAFACSGTIIAAARSMELLGALGVNDA